MPIASSTEERALVQDFLQAGFDAWRGTDLDKILGFPGNVHAMSGEFLGIPATGRCVNLPGCSFYSYDLDHNLITGGHLYFDVGTLMRQPGV